MRILWVKTELLHPLDKGGRIRSYHMLRALLRRHHVTYLCLDDGQSSPDARARATEYCSELITVPFSPPKKGSTSYALALLANLFDRLPYAVSRYRSSRQQARIRELAAGVQVLICDFLAPSQNVPDHLPTATALFQHNVESIIWERRAAVAGNALARAYLKLQWHRMRRFEASECRRFDRVVAVSDTDAATMRTLYGVASVTDVPTGVDVEYFSPPDAAARNPKELLFVGSMDWAPNEDGIRWFVDAVLPLVQARNPGVTLTIVGRAPSAALRRLADGRSGIEITGTVPDVRPYLHRAAASVVPLRVGGGTRIKIYEAMAAHVPVVSTSIGAEGLPLVPNEHLLIADRPDTLCEAITRLLNHPAQAQRMADAALRFVRQHCSWESVTEQFLLKSCPPSSEDAVA